MRTKETEEDYGYIFEPDLAKTIISKKQVSDAKRSLPELPEEKKKRFMKSYGLNEEIAESIVTELELAKLFEDVARKASPKVAGSWIAGYLKKTLNWNDVSFAESGIKPEWVMQIISMFEAGELTNKNAEMAIRHMVDEKMSAADVVKKHNLESGGVDVETIARKIISENRKAVDDYKSGNEKSLHFLVGQCMREARGKADANEIKKAIVRLLK